MKILVVDDGQLAINSLIRILCRVAPDCDYISAMTTEDALSWMRQGPMDAAFLNLEMPGMNGLALTRMIQKLQPRCNIIVVTEHPEYALEALQIFVSGFLLKPANEADVRNVLEHLRYPPENAPVGIKIQCFGNFEIFVGGRALAFKRSKSKELLAYLVDRNGATCTNGEMLAVLWEDKPDTASLHSHLRNLIFDLSHTLEDAGVTGLLIRGRSTLALDTSKVDCDYYNFLRGSRSATNSYRGEYALEALQIFVSGFLLKPANEADVRNVLEHLRYPPENAPVGIKIQCFGNFEIFVGGRALAFKRSKSKELLAYLVDRNGATCTNGEMLAVLWEDKPDTASLHSHLRNLIFDLSHTLEDAGVTGLLIRGRSTLALDTSKVDCDYYNFLRGSRSATNSYRGEYMTQYSWAEVTRSALRQQANVQKTASIPSYYVPPTGF